MRGSFIQVGVEENTSISYQVPIKEGTVIRETLAEAKKQGEGKFYWYRKTSAKFPDWIGDVSGKPVEGIEESMELAKLRILEGWRK